MNISSSSSSMRNIYFVLTFCFLVCLPNGLSAQLYSKYNGTQNTPFGSVTPRKFQLIYLPSDIENAPNTVIKTIYFRKNGVSVNTTITNFQIKLGFVSATSFPVNGTTFFTNLTPVFFASSFFHSGSFTTFPIEIDPVFMYQTGKTLVVEVSYTSCSANLPVRFSTGPGSPNHKRLHSSSLNSTTGSPDTDWLDFGFSPQPEELPSTNDLCTNAKSISLGTDCQPIIGNTAYATQNLPPAFCGGFSSTSANDVYYSFTANTSTDSFTVQGLGGFDPIVQIYSGVCGSLSNVRCSYTPSSDNLEKISPGNLVPGQKYFLRVYGNDGIDGSFQICGQSSSLLAPANDQCENAVLLPVSTVNTSIGGTTAGATESTPAISCNGNTSSSANDVWYKFVAKHPYDSVVVKSGGFMNPVVELYSGTCTNLTTISCSDRGDISFWERVTTGDLVPGTTYFVRVYGFGPTTGTFLISAKTPSTAPPANDESCDAIGLTLSADCNNQIYNNLGATQSREPINCQPNGLSTGAADVWFKFEFQTLFDTIIVSPVGDFNPVVEIFTSYGNCVQIVSERCSDGTDPQAVEKVHTMGVNNSTVYVRVYGFNGALGSFNLCAKKADPSVLYDQCVNAKLIAVSSVCTSQVGTTRNATPSTGIAACKGNPDDDVWYRFDPLGASTLVFRLKCDPGFDGAMQIFSGSCAGLTPLVCINRMGAGVQEDTVLVVPNAVLDYYVRIYHAGTGSGVGGYSLCVTQAAAPSNNNCNNAFVLQNGTNVCSPVNSTLYGASQSNAPLTCGGRTSTVANDVWYLFTATSSTMEINIKPIGGIDPVVQLFNGGCLTNTPRACADDSSAGKGETLIMTNAFVGNSYYFRVYSHSQSAAFGDFTVCVKNGNSCTTQPGTPNVSASTIVNNGRILLDLTGETPGANVQWQVSYNGGNSYSNLGVADANLPDTLTISVPGSQNVLVRALVSAPNCNSSTSAISTIAVRCATRFSQPIAATAGNYISEFTLHTLNKTSIPFVRNGSYESFTTTNVALCKGVSYPVSISHVPASASLTRVLWMDLNNDGDFSDANELLIPPSTGSGTLTQQLTIPTSVSTTGNIRIRVMVYDAGNNTPGSDPCFAGPYDSGEIEEYTVVLSNPVVALAGADKIVCSGNVNLSGSSPSPGFGLWSVISGPALVVSAGNANSPVTNIGLSPSVLVWKVTNGPCISSDTLTIRREANSLALRNDTTICEDDSLRLDAGPGYFGYLWVNGNNTRAITVYSQGTYWVQVTTQNNCTFRDSVEVNEQICTGVRGISMRKSGFDIYPNPSQGSFMVKATQPGHHKLRIFTSMGRLVATIEAKANEAENEIPVELPATSSGIYWVEMQYGSETAFSKLVIQ